MPMRICDNCLQYYSVNDYDSDFVHRCNSSYSALDKEDRFIIGPYIGERNEPGEGELHEIQREAALQGIQNKLGGTFAGIQLERLCTFTVRGNKAVYMRERQHYHYQKGLLRPASTRMKDIGVDLSVRNRL